MFFTIILLQLYFIVNEQTSFVESRNNSKHLKMVISNIPWILLRSRREQSNIDTSRDDYEKELNASIADYYAQRKAVMDRYYARQREIALKFDRKTSNKPLAVHQETYIDRNISVLMTTDKPEVSLNITRRESDYQRLGDCKFNEDEKLLYQHNLEVGLKGSSQLDATVQVNLDGPYTITCVEAQPYNNSRAKLSWLNGGLGVDFVKLNLKALENTGMSYTIKVWGIKSPK